MFLFVGQVDSPRVELLRMSRGPVQVHHREMGKGVGGGASIYIYIEKAVGSIN